MPQESNPVQASDVIDGDNPPPAGDQLPLKPAIAADFVQVDTDRPKADESTINTPAPPPGETPKGKPGRPRSDNPTKEALRSRQRYQNAKANRPPPPSFGDLPGGAGSSAPPPIAQAPIPGQPTIDYHANASACFKIVTGAMASISGPHWEPKSSGEEEMVVGSLAKYMEVKQWKDLSPGWALAVIGGMYVLPRVNDPITRKQIKKALDTIRGEKGSNAGHAVEVT